VDPPPGPGPVDIQAPETGDSSRILRLRSYLVVVATLSGLALLVFGLGWIPGAHNVRGESGLVVLFGGAAFLFAMAPYGWILFGRVVSRRTVRLTVTEEGLVAHRADDSRWLAPWMDPSFRATITVYSPDPAQAPALQWQCGGSVGYAQITRNGAATFEADARRHVLSVERETKGTPPRTWTVTRFRSG
jgi:hypothetical protein